ncbi:hypothetical protein [Acinetobacter johnsonii]|uniref:Uncharacterized protein n=1 Tax=Acinetobacter johnsonii TaxID=40214 RepID=A0AAW6RQE5_ACIJO|nr:hypothetical protein [Acinetobacter johnsonii]MDG9785863.1 hypothetical protein [Acinetobacter johnsonii]MDG9797878.1 hypothetical protein [Acinetobacter johnsonii]
MKQESNKRLYFTDDFSPENVAELQKQGYILRKASAYHEADTLEPCSEVAGDVPKAYLDLIKRNNSNIVTIEAKVGITPELQATIDQAKAECAKVIAENVELKDQLATAQGEFIAFKNDVAAMQARIDELQTPTKKPTAAELKAAKAAEEATKAEQSKE